MALTVWVAALVGGLPFEEGHPHAHAASLAGIHKIRHVVVVMQENRSFDSYFGTYPGADGMPGRREVHRLRARPDERDLPAAVPRHPDRNTGGPHEHFDAIARHRRRQDGRLPPARPGAG